MNERELKILTYLLSRLEKRIYLLRVSLYGKTGKYFPERVSVTPEVIENENNYIRTTYNVSENDYKLIVDSCEIEACIGRILREMENFQTFKSLEDIVAEFENENATFEKHQKMIQAKQRQIEQFKEILSEEQSEGVVERLDTKVQDANTEIKEETDSFCETEFIKKLMDHRKESRINYYDCKQDELNERIEWFQREARLQVHADVQTVSFWLLKYDDYVEKLDVMLIEIFDNWAQKQRECEILKKFRRLNLERIQKLQNLILEREEYIEEYRVKKEKEQKKREEELKKEFAAIVIQAYWKGTMVRKHLGPYKIKKKSKKKGKGKKKK